MATTASLIAELEDAVQAGSPERRVATLRRVTDLFLAGADRFNDEQISVFDDVLCHLISRIEARVLGELSARLAPVDNAPREVILSLARHDELAVAEPVLTGSQRLTSDDLIAIAETKSEGHLAAIAGRAEISEAVTDVLLQRGTPAVTRKLAGNAGARFSAQGFSHMAQAAEGDDLLALALSARPDMPPELMETLLHRATQTVRERLLAEAPSESRAAMEHAVDSVAAAIGRETGTRRDFRNAKERMTARQAAGALNEALVLSLIEQKDYEDLVAALALLSEISIDYIDRLMRTESHDGLMILCKAAALHWPTVVPLLRLRAPRRPISENELKLARTDFLRLSQSTARRVLRFWQTRQAAAISTAGR
jgi:uncharacterized protein (DUF2336 family)